LGRIVKGAWVSTCRVQLIAASSWIPVGQIAKTNGGMLITPSGLIVVTTAECRLRVVGIPACEWTQILHDTNRKWLKSHEESPMEGTGHIGNCSIGHEKYLGGIRGE